MRLAYADPPYPGLSRRYYGDHPDFAGEVDHGALLERLRPLDGWALSTSAAALPMVLGLARELALDVEVAAWVKGARNGRSGKPRSSWEPVLYCGGRREVSLARACDSFVYGSRGRSTDPRNVIGAKPAAFLWWLFDLLGALPGDELADLYPGSGGVSRAWALYSARVLPRCSRDASPSADGSTPATRRGGPRGDRDASPSTSPETSRRARAAQLDASRGAGAGSRDASGDASRVDDAFPARSSRDASHLEAASTYDASRGAA